LVQQLKNGEDVQVGSKKMNAKASLPEEYVQLRQRVADLFQAKVQMSCSPSGKGKISISFANEEELEHIMSVLDQMKG